MFADVLAAQLSLAAGVSLESARYLRVASITIAAWECVFSHPPGFALTGNTAFCRYIVTLGAEWAFYKTQKRITRPSLACILFFLIRYTSIIVIVVSNIGSFGHFTPEQCRHFFLVSPAFKVLQTVVSQAVLGVRTFAIAKRNRIVGYFTLALFISMGALEGFSSLYARVPVNNETQACVLTFFVISDIDAS
ncbi:hypothetical protein AURDEDRAFT_168241 [Auricularia subglabra TFB-10046 SS5]|nr:hypothetical protein AURDEDRAFT_168241 [Auricularia subglabra TFB-10046 SS5]